MKNFLFVLFAIFLVSSFSFAEMKLKLRSDLMNSQTQSVINKNLETNLKLNIPAEVAPPADMKDFVKGMIMLGILADVSFPMGDGFKHVAGTGFSGHVVGSYLVSKSFLIALRAGYITFGTQTEEGSVPGFYDYKYEDTYSQIPILLGAYYLFSAGSSFKPYIGAALGVFFQTYKVNWQEDYGFGEPDVLDESFTSTGFGIVPAVGFYYLLGSVVLQVSAEYALLFSEGPTVEYDYVVPTLEKGSNYTGIAQDEGTDEETSDKASYISVNLGVSFPLGK